MRDFPEILRQPVSTVEQAQAAIRALVDNDMDFHLEDSASEFVGALWSEADAPVIDQRRGEFYAIDDWGIWDCPIGYMLAYMAETGRDPFWHLNGHEEYENGHLAKVVFVDAENPRYAVLEKAWQGKTWLEVSYRDMTMFADGSWSNAFEGESNPQIGLVGGEFTTLPNAQLGINYCKHLNAQERD